MPLESQTEGYHWNSERVWYSSPHCICTSIAVNEMTCVFFSVGILPKRETSRRKAKENSSTRRIMQERLLEDDEEMPGLGNLLLHAANTK